MTKVSSLPKTDTISEDDNVVISTSAGKTQLASTNALATSISVSGGSGGGGFVLEKETSFSKYAKNSGSSDEVTGTVVWYDPSSEEIHSHAYRTESNIGGAQTVLPAGAVILGIWPNTSK